MGIKISDLPSIGTLESEDLVVIVDESETPVTSKCTLQQLANFNNSMSISEATSLSAGPTMFFINNEDNYNITLPNPSTVIGVQLFFITTVNTGEQYLGISPYGDENIEGSNSTFYMGGPATLILCSDGTDWWIISTYNV